MKPKLSIIIPTHKNIFLKDVLLSILHCFGYDESVEVIVVENPEITKEVKQTIKDVCNGRQHKNIHHISSELGANKARNVGIKHSTSNVITLIDDDCVVDRNWLNMIVSSHMVYPYVGVIGGSMKLIFQATKPRWIEGFFWNMLAGVDHGDGIIDFSKVADKYVGMIVSGNLSFKRYVYDQTQGFDETVGYVGKEALMAHDEIRLIHECSELGSPKRLYIGNIIVYHYIPENRLRLEYFLKRSYGDGYNFVKMICNDPINEHKTPYDIIVEHILPRWESYLGVGDLAYIRNRIAHEESTRQYITHVLKCKTEFFRGCCTYLDEYKPLSINYNDVLIRSQTNAL